MDQKKIDGFIALCRKEAGLTQATLAEKLGITDRAVSKWERGINMPDVSLMPELCELLHINLNELLTGEKIDMDDYKDKAEKLLLELKRQEELNNKKLLSLENVIGYISSVAFFIMIFAASFAVEVLWWRIALIAAGLVIFAVGIGFAVKLEREAGYYECQHCGERYLPTLKSVVLAPHIGRSRKMKCPVCGKKSYHKKVLTK